MDPAFILPQMPAPVFGRTTNFEYKKILPDPTFNANNPVGRHTFRFQNQAGEWWVPSQSYIRLRLAFLVADGTNTFRPVTPADGVAPVMNLPAHLFSRIEYYMDGNKLSDLQDHIPQIDTMKNRMTKSSKWFETVGHRSAFWDPDFTTRQSQVCSDYINGASGIVSDGRLASERAVVLEGRPVAYSGELLPNLDAKSTVAPSNGESASYFFTNALERKTFEFDTKLEGISSASITAGDEAEEAIADLGRGEDMRLRCAAW
jgi:hypothetical protein